MELWKHQKTGMDMTFDLMRRGVKEIVFCCGTGGGKTRTMCEMSKVFVAQSGTVALYTNRIKLTAQSAPRFADAGLSVGIRAAGFGELRDDNADVQICSYQTELARVIKKRLRHPLGGEIAKRHHPLVKADVVFIDEAHGMRSETMLSMIDEHIELGATVIMVTATPVGMKRKNTKLIVAGLNSELRDCGALLRAKVFAPDEVDMRFVRKTSSQEYLLNNRYKNIWRQTVVGRIYDHWLIYNPESLPTINFAPCVESSLWIAKEFHSHGVSSLHVDAKTIWLNGKEMSNNRRNWSEVLEMLEAGEITFTSNRFILREGFDCSIYYHAIFSTPIASFKAFIQSVGRVLRNHPGYDRIIVQDHAGNSWRHPSPNADHDWHELFDADEYKVSQELQEDYANDTEPEPICCPKCFAMRSSGPVCGECGFSHELSSRRIIQLNGTLREVTGKANKKQVVSKQTDTEKKWASIYYQMLNASKKGKLKTFNQVMGYFKHTHHYRPPKDLPLMPKNPADWDSHVTSVPRKDLL